MNFFERSRVAAYEEKEIESLFQENIISENQNERNTYEQEINVIDQNQQELKQSVFAAEELFRKLQLGVESLPIMQQELRKLFITEELFSQNQATLESFLSTVFAIIQRISEFQPDDWIETVVPDFIKDKFVPNDDI